MKRKFVALFMVIALCISLSACGNNTGGNNEEGSRTGNDESASPSAGGANDEKDGSAGTGEEKVLLVSLGADPASYNPVAQADDNAYMVNQNIFNGLVSLNSNSEIIPDLAKSWDISKDGKTYTFHLNEGVKWHDGVDFTSDDVKFTYEKIMSDNGYLAGGLTSAIESIECPDANTVVINLKNADATFLSTISWYCNFIIPKHIYDTTDDWTKIDAATTAPIGTGPFKFVEARSGVSITLEKNEEYFGGEPKIDKVVYVISTDQDTAYQAFLNGELDYLQDVPASGVAALQNDPNYKLGVLTAARRYQMCFNMNGKNTSDLAVRRAIAKTIDRDEISKKGTAGLQAPAYGFYPPFLDWAYNDQADIGERDVEGAVKLLEDAGYTKDSDGYYLHLGLEVFTGGNYADCAKVIKSELAEIGIDVTIDMLEESAWIEKVLGTGDYDLCILAGYQGPDPDNMTTRVGTGGGLNVSYYSNAEVDDLLAQAKLLTDQNARGELYKEVQKILSEDLPLVPLVEYAGYYACKSNINGLPYIEDNPDIAPGNFSKAEIN